MHETICILTNAHNTGDVRLYHKLGKSLCKIGKVYILGPSGTGSRMEDYELFCNPNSDNTDEHKPIQIIVSGRNPVFRLFYLYKQALLIKPTIVICIEPLTMFIGLLLKKKFACLLCYDAHEYYSIAHGEKYNFPLSAIMEGIYAFIEHSLQKQMDLTITVNEELFKYYCLISCVENQKHLNNTTKSHKKIPHWGVVCQNYPTKAIWNRLDRGAAGSLIPDIIFDAVYLGGISEDRGCLKLLKAIDLLKLKRPQLKVLFVGSFKDDVIKKRFFEFVAYNNLNAHVFWRESISHDKVCPVLKQAKIGLCLLNPANRRYKKALPLKILEYLAAGLPVVANTFPPVREIIEKHKLGYCVPYQKQEIASAIDKLLNLDEYNLQQISHRCQKVIIEEYNWDKVEPNLLSAMQFIRERQPL